MNRTQAQRLTKATTARKQKWELRWRENERIAQQMNDERAIRLAAGTWGEEPLRIHYTPMLGGGALLGLLVLCGIALAALLVGLIRGFS